MLLTLCTFVGVVFACSNHEATGLRTTLRDPAAQTYQTQTRNCFRCTTIDVEISSANGTVQPNRTTPLADPRFRSSLARSRTTPLRAVLRCRWHSTTLDRSAKRSAGHFGLE